MWITAPGKILLLGGYAVLEGYPALSIAMCDRKGLGVSVKVEEREAMVVSKEFKISKSISLQNPLSSIKGLAKDERISAIAYATAVAYLKGKGIEPKGLKVDISNSPIFGTKEEKSGLGSSAAATVAIVASVLVGNGVDIDTNKDVIHKIAQISHALASEKIGSGFDVATATYGSIKYIRYHPNSIDLAIADLNELSIEMVHLTNKHWPGLKIRKCSLNGYDIIAFNIGGAKTSTISSVKAVRQLKETNREIYLKLITEQVKGESLVFKALGEKDDERIRTGMHIAREAQRRITREIEAIGIKNFDPIEPPIISNLIEEVEKLDGVIAGRCPGAGGYDSVAFLVDRKKRKRIKEIIRAGEELGLKLQHLDAMLSSDGVRKINRRY